MFDSQAIAALVLGILKQRSNLMFAAATRGIDVDQLMAAAITEAIRREVTDEQQLGDDCPHCGESLECEENANPVVCGHCGEEIE